MEKAILAFLRHRAFWRQVIGTTCPDLKAHYKSVQAPLSNEYLKQKAMIKVIDVN